MDLKVLESYEDVVNAGAKILEKRIKKSEKSTIGLATGNTFLKFYEKLVEKHTQEKLSFSKTTTFNLDEYVDLPKTHPESFHNYMNENFFHHVDIPKENFHIPDGNANNLKKECEEYEKKIYESGGIDLQFLGIGKNGHIGYNEPGSSFDSRTRVIELDEKTIQSKAEDFGSVEEVPRKAITMGIGTILESEEIVLLANGEKKAEAVKKTIEGPITEDIPSTALREHENCKIIVDEKAASKTSIQ